MDAGTLLRLHLALEGVGLDAAGDMFCIFDANTDTLCRVYVVRLAGAVLRAGKVPFYSYRADDAPSAAPARSLGLIPYSEDAAYA